MWKLCGVLVFLVTVQSASLRDRKLKLFPLDPLEIVELKLDEGNNRGIAYKLQKAKVTGFKNAQFETINTTVEAKITFEGNMKREEKDGKKYIKVVDPTIKMVPKRVYISMTNLFNGNELLGREMNEFMNKNWKEVNEEISPPVEQAIAEIVVGGINQLLGSTPEENLFPEKLP
ncbi:hypothetical protein C0J52_12951 [Blattella germanica]|nr:hypothetical protein C0J52_12951 [Blattella germanica]